MLASRATLWLLDEPTVALDRVSVAATESAIAEQRAQDGMVVVSTNAPIEVANAHALDLGDDAPPVATAEAFATEVGL